jgi:hypothetical protein
MYYDGWQAQDVPFNMMAGENSHNPFYGGGPMAVSEAHRLDNDLQMRQDLGMSNHGPGASSHVAAMNGDRDNGHPGGNPALNSDPPMRQPEVAFYNAATKPYAHLDHPGSSPIGGHELTHPDGAFGPGPSASRRRSAADIRQPQKPAWQTETPGSYKDATRRGKHPPSRPLTPPMESIVSSTRESESQSRHPSATPSRPKGHTGGNPADSMAQPSYLSTMDLSQRSAQSLAGRPAMALLRRHSTASIHDVGMADLPPPPGDAMAPEPMVQQVQQQQQQRAWPTQQPHATPNGPPNPGPYTVHMADHGMAYDQRFQPPLAHPASQIITTGPFTGHTDGHAWWSR